MIGLYAIVAQPPAELTGARGEPLRALRCGNVWLLAGDAPPPLSPEALRAHDAAARRIAQACEACLPARFGAAASGDDELVASLLPRAQELAEALRVVSGREQMTLRIHGALALPPPAASGTRYLEDRRRAQRIPELDPLRAALEGIARAERVERHGQPGLVASVYHLIDRGASEAYRRAVAAAPLGELRVSVSGPWPGWSFAPEALQ